MRRHSVFFSLAFTISACDNDTAPPVTVDPTVPVTITLAASTSGTLTSIGDTRTVSATVKNGTGGVIESPNVVWSSSAPSVATVVNNSAGNTVVTAVGDGTATITARSGSIESTVQVTVHQTMESVSLTAPSNLLEYGLSTQLVAKALDARNNVIPDVQGFMFTSDNPGTAFVQPNGVVTALFRFPQLPSATITATLKRDGRTALTQFQVTVGPPTRFTYATLMLTENVVPLNPPTRGAGIAYILNAPEQLAYHVLWSDLASPVTHVQIRGPAAYNVNADLLVELGPRPELDSLGHIKNVITSANIESQNGRPPISLDSLRSLLCSRLAYVEVRTVRHPNGEIRGQFDCIDFPRDDPFHDIKTMRASKF